MRSYRAGGARGSTWPRPTRTISIFLDDALLQGRRSLPRPGRSTSVTLNVSGVESPTLASFRAWYGALARNLCADHDQLRHQHALERAARGTPPTLPAAARAAAHLHTAPARQLAPHDKRAQPRSFNLKRRRQSPLLWRGRTLTAQTLSRRSPRRRSRRGHLQKGSSTTRRRLPRRRSRLEEVAAS
jgi:hypothetical protein